MSRGLFQSQQRNRRPRSCLQPHGPAVTQEPRGCGTAASCPDVAGGTLGHTRRTCCRARPRNPQSARRYRRGGRNRRPRPTCDQPGVCCGRGRSSGDRADQPHSHRLPANGPSAPTRGSSERPQYNGGTCSYAGMPASGLHSDQDRTPERPDSAKRRTRQQADSPTGFESLVERGSSD